MPPSLPHASLRANKPRLPMKVYVVAAMCLMSAFYMSGQAQRVSTLRTGRLEPALRAPESITVATVADSAAICALTVSAYDKPLRSLRETFFVTNSNLSDTVTSLRLTFTYHTVADSLMLHRRTVTVPCDIPPGQTRQLYTTAWDRQYTYYSAGTRIQPSSNKAIPYLTTIEIVAATVKKQ